jgi:hypothetical protein
LGVLQYAVNFIQELLFTLSETAFDIDPHQIDGSFVDESAADERIREIQQNYDTREHNHRKLIFSAVLERLKMLTR